MRPLRDPLPVGVAWGLTAVILLTTVTESAEPAQRRTWFVRQTVGDDANDGSSADEAWRSLAKLANTLHPGDTAYVGPGLYRETLLVASSGTAEERITLIADTSGTHTGDPPGIVMVTGADTVDETMFEALTTPGVYKAPNSEGHVLGVVEMDGLQYRYSDAWDTPKRLKEGVAELDVVARLPSSFSYDRAARVVYVHTSDGKPPSTHEIELIRRREGIATYGKHYITVIGFTFRHMRVAGINFETGSDHCVALNNTSFGAWQGIRVSNSDDALVAGNTLFRNGNSGVYFLQASARGYAFGNVLYENAKGARWSSDSGDGIALYNVAFDNREAGIAIESSHGIQIMGNALVNNELSQLRVRNCRYLSQGNCFATGAAGQLVAHLGYRDRYETLSAYQQAADQDLLSAEVCGPLPDKVDVRRLQAETQVYPECARELLVRPAEEAQER